jgi:hypothetical protein
MYKGKRGKKEVIYLSKKTPPKKTGVSFTTRG